jgi:hypothetical protein
MQVHMGQPRRPQPGAAREEGARQVEGDAVDVQAGQAAQSYIDPAHEEERREEVLAELAIRDPRLPLLIPLEGQGVDEDGPSLDELDVERAGVLERHAPGEGPALDVQREQGGVPELEKRHS